MGVPACPNSSTVSCWSPCEPVSNTWMTLSAATHRLWGRANANGFNSSSDCRVENWYSSMPCDSKQGTLHSYYWTVMVLCECVCVCVCVCQTPLPNTSNLVEKETFRLYLSSVQRTTSDSGNNLWLIKAGSCHCIRLLLLHSDELHYLYCMLTQQLFSRQFLKECGSTLN